ncbi:hypothetical protein AC1031_008981 [Aphanomyces cochlioides]|nr:hypothetical protein AC1031_008981 [Aphanomyces cochlioides]
MVTFSLSEELDKFRGAENEDDFVRALSLISVLLLSSRDRRDFSTRDGATTIGDHLLRLCLEQSTVVDKWSTSRAFGFSLSKGAMDEVVRYLIISITHAALDINMAQQLCSMNLAQVLFDEFIKSQPQQDNDVAKQPTRMEGCSLRVIALEALRNLMYPEREQPQLSNESLDSLWQILLGPHADEDEIERQLSCDILTNLAFHNPRASLSTKERLSLLLSILLHEDAHGNPLSSAQPTELLQAALVDLACNLSRDTEYSILFICALEEHKPRSRLSTSSIAFLTLWAESTTDNGLRASLEAWTRNLAWSDVSTKVCVQKLSASSFVERFIFHEDQTL